MVYKWLRKMQKGETRRGSGTKRGETRGNSERKKYEIRHFLSRNPWPNKPSSMQDKHSSPKNFTYNNEKANIFFQENRCFLGECINLRLALFPPVLCLLKSRSEFLSSSQLSARVKLDPIPGDLLCKESLWNAEFLKCFPAFSFEVIFFPFCLLYYIMLRRNAMSHP